MGSHWELERNMLRTKEKMKRWNYIQTFVTIFHLFFGAGWVYVVAGWAIWKLALMHVH
jgi:hypothetical protein